METDLDILAELEEVSARLAGERDISGRTFADLLDHRGLLIRRLVKDGFDPADPRLGAIIASAEILQERLRDHADSVRADLAASTSTGAFVGALRATCAIARAKAVDFRI